MSLEVRSPSGSRDSLSSPNSNPNWNRYLDIRCPFGVVRQLLLPGVLEEPHVVRAQSEVDVPNPSAA